MFLRRRHTISRRASIAALGGLAFAAQAASADQPPPTIRIAAVSAGYGEPYGQQAPGIMQARRYVEEGFQTASVRVQWTFPDGAGPEINEQIADGQIDFAAYGDLPAIIGHAGGLTTRVIGTRGTEIMYVVVRTAVRAAKIADLKGLRVTLQRGGIVHQLFDRLLAENGMTESDVQIFDLKMTDQIFALTTGNVDAAVGTLPLLSLRDQGIVRILYTNKGKVTPDGFGAFVVTKDFSDRYPAATLTVVSALVKAAYWLSLDANREEVLQAWERSGTPRN